MMSIMKIPILSLLMSLLLFLIKVVAADPWLVVEGKEGIGKGQHIVFVTGEEYYRSEEGMSMFAQILARHHGFKCTVLYAIDPDTGSINPNCRTNIPGLAALKTADLMVIFARFRELPDADMQHIADYVNAGKPVLGIRNATHAFRYANDSSSKFKNWDFQSNEWPGGFGQQILGDTWIAHFGAFQKEATMALVNRGLRNHPVLKGVGDKIFCHTDVNTVSRLTDGDTVLFHGQVLSGLLPSDPPVADDRKETRMPFAWFKNYTAPSGVVGRSFTTTAGASLDWQSEDLRRLMVNAMFSLTGHESEIPDRTNVSFVTAYSPQPTGMIEDAVWESAKLSRDRWMLSGMVGQEPIYTNPIEVKPPYYRVTYQVDSYATRLSYPVSYTIWVPPGVPTLRGLIVHQHGCGEGSCKSGQTGAFDLHWQALAKKHQCALMSPSYEQPDKANCQLWCDPRNGSDEAFQRSLVDLGTQSGHPELSTVPWALWGHSGGGHWAGAMMLLYPQRVAAAWLRSGVPPLMEAEGKPKPFTISPGALEVPVMCNLGTQEGVTVKDGRFSGVWSSNATFFRILRGEGGLVCVSIDPLSSHDCGNQRYLAIPWFDACLTLRLPNTASEPLRAMPKGGSWLALLNADGEIESQAFAEADFSLITANSVWLPSETIARAWTRYMSDSGVEDNTPPPAPTNLIVRGNELTWDAEADLESGLAGFVIERDGQFLTNYPEENKNPFGRPVFQRLQYSDTPAQPLVTMRFVDTTAEAGRVYRYQVYALNTVGLKSP